MHPKFIMDVISSINTHTHTFFGHSFGESPSLSPKQAALALTCDPPHLAAEYRRTAERHPCSTPRTCEIRGDLAMTNFPGGNTWCPLVDMLLDLQAAKTIYMYPHTHGSMYMIPNIKQYNDMKYNNI